MYCNVSYCHEGSCYFFLIPPKITLYFTESDFRHSLQQHDQDYLFVAQSLNKKWMALIAYSITIYSIVYGNGQRSQRVLLKPPQVQCTLKTLTDDISEMNHPPRNKKCQLGNEKLSPPLFTYWPTLCGRPRWEQHTASNSMISLGGKRVVTVNLVL